MKEDIAKVVEKLIELNRLHRDALERSNAAQEAHTALKAEVYALFGQKLTAEHELLQLVDSPA